MFSHPSTTASDESVDRRPFALAIDLSYYVPGKAIGFNEYISSLLTGFNGLVSVDFSITCYVRARYANSLQADYPSILFRPLPYSGLVSPRFLFHIYYYCKRHHFDCFLFPNNFLPLFFPRNSFVVVHDLGFLACPLSFGFAQRIYRWLFSMYSLTNAYRVIAISNQTSAEIFDYSGVKSRVIYNPVRVSVYRGPTRSTNTIVCPSSLAPHKNIVNAYSACIEILNDNPDFSCDFVFCGNWSQQQFPSVSVHPRIHLVGFLSHEDLVTLFSSCQAFLLPSIYEGFGMPYIESISMGKCLICSDIPIARELADGYPVYIDSPFGIKEISDAILRASLQSFIPGPAPMSLSCVDPTKSAQQYLDFFTLSC